MKRYLPTLVSGFAAAVITTIPFFRDMGFCLIIPAAAGFSLYLDQKSSGNFDRIPGSKAFIFGLYTALFGALFATFFDSLITLVSHTNSFVESLPLAEDSLKQIFSGIDPNASDEALMMLRKIASEIKTNGFSPVYTIFSLIGNLFIYSLTGIIGAFIGMVLINRRNQTRQI